MKKFMIVSCLSVSLCSVAAFAEKILPANYLHIRSLPAELLGWCGGRKAVLVFLVATTGTSQAQAPSQIAEYKVGEYTFKLMNQGQSGQIFEGAKFVATIYTVNGQQQIIPAVPEPDATKVKKVFEDWKTSGQQGSTAPPKIPISFESEGTAIVPLADGSVVTFKSTYVEVAQPNALASLPGQIPVNTTRFELGSPSLGASVLKNKTGIYINGVERKNPSTLFSGNYRQARKINNSLKVLSAPVNQAADLADADAHKPSNALDYKAMAKKVQKRIDESF